MNGEAGWKIIGAAPVSEEAALVAMGQGDGTTGGKDFKVVEWLESLGLKSLLDSVDGDGGGWQNAGLKAGEVSKVTGDITWTLKCACLSCWGCPAKLKSVWVRALNKLEIKHAVNWLHLHQGTLLTKEGLPPNIRVMVDRIVQANPTIKFRPVCHMLYEQHGVERDELESRIRTYYYRHAAARGAAEQVRGRAAARTLARRAR